MSKECLIWPNGESVDLHEFLIDSLYFLVATLVFVPAFRWLKLGSMLGYIVAGILVGPMCLGLIDNSKSIFQLAELGIILLLFIVGLELSPTRLKVLRKDILFEGGSQMLLTTLALTGVGYYAGGIELIPSFVIAVALSLSSTAFALTYLTDNSQLTLSHGHTSLSILLFQDLLIVPILAFIPLLSVDQAGYEALNFSAIALKFVLFSTVLTVCFFVLKPAISFIRKTQDPEIFLAAFLFLIVGMGVGMEKMGLSTAMGSFLAGVLLANSEIKTDIKSMTIPFKGILMGLFFMTLGMEFELAFFMENLKAIGFLCAGILMLKGAVLFGIGSIRSGSLKSGFRLSLLLSQGGEFGIVVIGSALQFNILDQEINKLLVSSIIITMMVAPFLARLTALSSPQNHAQEEEFAEVIELSQRNVIIPIESDKKAS